MNYLFFCYKLQIPKYQTIYAFVTQTTDSKVMKLHSLSKYCIRIFEHKVTPFYESI